MPSGSHGHWSLLPPYLSGSFQIFADGRLVAQCGALPPKPAVRFCPAAAVSLPVLAAGKTLTVAIRIYDKGLYEFGMRGRGYVGPSDEIRSLADSARDSDWRFLAPYAFIMLAEVLGALFSLWLYWMSRGREYLWFGLLLLAGAVGNWLSIGGIGYVYNPPLEVLMNSAGVLLWNLAMLAFLYVLLSARRSVLFYVALAGTVASLSGDFGILGEFFNWLPGGVLTTLSLGNILLTLPATIWIFVLLVRGAWQGSFEARLCCSRSRWSSFRVYSTPFGSQACGWGG